MEVTGQKFLFLIVFIAVAVSPCVGFRSRFRARSGYHGYYYGYYSSSRGTSTGTIVGAVIGGLIVILGICVLVFILRRLCAKKQQQRGRQMTSVSGNIPHTTAPPPYSTYDTSYKTGTQFNTNDNFGYLPPEEYKNSNPNTLPPPYSANFSSTQCPDQPTCPPYQTFPGQQTSTYPTDSLSPPYPQTSGSFYPQPYPIYNMTPSAGYSAESFANQYDPNPEPSSTPLTGPQASPDKQTAV